MGDSTKTLPKRASLKTVIIGSFNSFLLNNLANDIKEDTSCSIFNIHKPVNIISKTIRKYHFKLFNAFHHVWYSDFYNIKDVERIIVFDSIFNMQLLDDIRSNFKEAKIIFYYWNSITSLKDLNIIKSKVDGVYSFDFNDCDKYNLFFNSQFYFNINNDTNVLPVYDSYFIGYDKGRFKILKQIADILEKNNFNVLFQIKANTSRKIKYKIPIKYKISAEIDYRAIIDNIKSSKSIIDIVQKDQSGLTLRAMESLFLDKKLITNNKYIKDYDFFKKDNIFILDDYNSNLDKLIMFLNGHYIKIGDNIKQKYLFNNWINNFNQW